MNEKFTEIGKIVNTHGIKGTVKIYPYTDDLNRFSKLDRVFVGESKDILYLESINIRKNMVYMSFKDFDSINDVLSFKNSLIYILNEERIPLKKDQFYISDILGLNVYDESGQYLGEVIDLLQGPGNDIYIIKDKNSTWMLPGVKEFILSINIQEEKMIIRPIEGMKP